MRGGHARVVFPAPPSAVPAGASSSGGWTAATVPEPSLGGGTGAVVTQWEVRQSESTSDTLLVGCVDTPIPGWVDDMRLAVDARTVALMHGAAERMTGGPLEVSGESPDF